MINLFGPVPGHAAGRMSAVSDATLNKQGASRITVILNRLPAILIRVFAASLLSGFSMQASAGWSAGAAGCFDSFQTAMGAVCAANNPDSTSSPPFVYYKDSCAITSIPNFIVYAHMVKPATGWYERFSYYSSLSQCTACPANMSGNPCVCSTGFVPNTAGAGCIQEQYIISEPQDQAQLPDIEPGSTRGSSVKVVSALTGLPKQGAVVKIHLDVDISSGGHEDR